MPLSIFLRDQFSLPVRHRGNQICCANKVQVISLNAEGVVARVQGAQAFAVKMTRSGTSLSVACSCPYFDEIALCKHLWATILTVEREVGPELFEEVSELDEVLPDVGDDDDDDDDEDALDDDDDDEYEDDFYDEDEETVLLLNEEGDTREVSSRIAQFLVSHEGYQRVEDPASLTSLLVKQRWERTLRNISRQDRPQRAVAPPRDTEEALPLYFLEVGHLDDRDGQPVISVWLRSRKKSGGWGLPRPLKRKDLPAVTDPDHRQLLAMLMGAQRDFFYSYDHRSSTNLKCVLSHSTLDVTLPALCRTGRMRVVPIYPRYASINKLKPLLAAALEAPPLRLDEGPPWRFRLVVRPGRSGEPLLDEHPAGSRAPAQVEGDPDTPSIVIDGELYREEETLAVTEPIRLYDNGWILLADRIARLDHGGGFSWIQTLRQDGRLSFPGESAVEALRELVSLPALPDLEVDGDCGIRTVNGEPRPIVSIHRAGARATLHAKPSFEYDHSLVEAQSRVCGTLSGDGTTFLRRDFEAEERHLRALVEAGVTPLGRRTDDAYTHRLGAGDLPTAVTTLIQVGWRVEAEGRLYRQAGDLQFRVSTGIDWFDLKAEADFDGVSVPMPALLEAVSRGTRELVLDDGSLGLLPEDWLRQLGLLVGLGSKRRGQLRFGRNQAALLDLMLSTRPEVDVDRQFAKIRQEFRSFETVESRRESRGFTGTLRGYQREGLGWLAFLRRFGLGGCLADDMGLGKTVEALAALWELRGETDEHRPSLVVAPKSVVWNWAAEAARFTPGLRVHEHTGTGRSRDPAELTSYDLVLTTYGVLRRDAALLSEIEFDYAILDEAQAIKNARTATAKAARLLQARYRLALSGTPIENHLGELWSLFEFLNPGMLGRSAAFGYAPDGHDLDDETRLLLARALRPYILRRTKAQVATELPERTEQTLYCDLSANQRKIYDELRDHYRQALLAKRTGHGGGSGRFQGSKVHVLEALLRLRQAACHPGLVDPAAYGDGPSAKLDLLMEQLVELAGSGHKALVFSQFTKLLGLLKVRLDEVGLTYEYLDGRTRKRQPKIERFQADPDLPLFLISLKAGGLGLNLTSADYVFLLDPWWNPAVEAQAIDRAHRIGQTRPVVAYRVIARDTVEAKVLELQERKRDLADAIINADNRLIRHLTMDDLELLLG